MNQGSGPDRGERQSGLNAAPADRSGAGQTARFQARPSSKSGVPVTGPVAISVLLHAMLVAMMWINIDSADKIVQVPRHIQAVMIDEETLQAMLAASKNEPELKPEPKPEPEPQPEPLKPEPKPEVKPEPPKPDPEVVRLKAEQKAAEDAAEQARLAAEKEQARLAALALKKKKDEEQRKLEEQARAEKRKKDEALAKQEAAEKAKDKREEVEFLKQQQLAKEKQRELDRQARQKERDADRQKERENAETKRVAKLKSAEERRLADQASKFEEMFDKQSSSSSQTNNQISNARMEALSRESDQLIAQITEKIERSWIEPPGRNRGLKVDIRLELLPTGELKTARIVSGSGNSGFDQSALNAAFAVSRYPVPRDVSLFNRTFRNITIQFRPN